MGYGPEDVIKKEIVEWLEAQPWVGDVEDTDRSRASRGRIGTPTGSRKGRPDLRGHTTSGRAFYFETKAGRRKATPEQTAFIVRAHRHGCITGIVRSLAEVQLICRSEGLVKI